MKTKTLIETDRIKNRADTSALEGQVRIDRRKAAWLLAMLAGSALGLGWYATLPNVLVFVVGSALTLSAGHSVGLHRLLIHRSFVTPLWLERALVYLGTLVSMGGPFEMIRMHELRDWGQRQENCHAYFAHRGGFIRDAWEQLFCRFNLVHPPELYVERRVTEDRVYRFLNTTLYWQQLPWAILLYVWGGVGAVLWGVCLRIATSLIGHWMVGYFAHQTGPQNWEIDDMNVAGANLPFIGFLAMGEGFHNNHHAYPESARLGIKKWEWDPGWWVIRALQVAGLARDICTERDLPPRREKVAQDRSRSVG